MLLLSCFPSIERLGNDWILLVGESEIEREREKRGYGVGGEREEKDRERARGRMREGKVAKSCEGRITTTHHTTPPGGGGGRGGDVYKMDIASTRGRTNALPRKGVWSGEEESATRGMC